MAEDLPAQPKQDALPDYRLRPYLPPVSRQVKRRVAEKEYYGVIQSGFFPRHDVFIDRQSHQIGAGDDGAGIEQRRHDGQDDGYFMGGEILSHARHDARIVGFPENDIIGFAEAAPGM